MNITDSQLKQIIPTNPNYDGWIDALNTNLPQYGIDTLERTAAFLAQAAHESADFVRLRENLNYGAPGLIKTWPKRFTQETAQACARQPEKIANIVYASRMGNGDTASGDGWKFRGRGLFQLTGHDNYAACSQDLFSDDRLITNPELVETPEVAVQTACWYWNKNKLNIWADTGDIKELTRRINNGYTGIEDRIAHYNIAMKVLGE
jgi:putative chitinase